ncbi:class II glutamine amidotransferase [Stigmatella sp. ncwal1]|uniref:Class II glutamine amidotransferase n=1 Tax=Stigmatella ashevillensis TaxID=2995309 RepID=A0ABT5D674_9BACT|nr:class II glutamine amidotransferase [Stigmatella ashevillena]MDC0709071.1 class II glutamine amidotransferase [Stigmatella ashevillena]
MPNVLAMSFEGDLAPSFDLLCLKPHRKPPDGWGIGYYPGGDPAAEVLKEAAPPPGSIRSELVRAWEHLASPLFVVHIRTATWGQISAANTQPFRRAWAGRDWLMAHSGSLSHRLELPVPQRFEPIGSTDTELIFCQLMSVLSDKGLRSLGDIEPEALRAFFDAMNEHGSVTSILTDGRDLCVYADRDPEREVHIWTLHPPHDSLVFGDGDLTIDLTKRGIKSRKGVIVCSNPLEPQGDAKVDWKRLEPGSLLRIRQGAVVAEARRPVAQVQVPQQIPDTQVAAPAPESPGAALFQAPFVARIRDLKLPSKAEVQRFSVVHRTVYTYENPIERSTHVLRLRPVHDGLQAVIGHQLHLSVDGQRRDYDDVFGNRATRVLIETPYTELAIEARSTVELYDTDPVQFRAPHSRSSIPLVWMPWQRQVLEPFLLPQELPETELMELIEYAMSFVERNGYDLLDTLLDINSTIFREYKYLQGSTTVHTTPFEVYTNRHGVCQDFTNLFICMARLLGVPARYACGYIYCGPQNPNQRQAEASHAWLQLYLPDVGWRGFDPTNGILTQTAHVRVAVGRGYGDATPTSGTIFVGGGAEKLNVDVRVERIA